MVDGHNIEELLKAFSCARTVKNKPVALICKTYKGQDFPGIADQENWHGKPLGSKAKEVLDYLNAQISNTSVGSYPLPSKPLDDCSELKLMGTIKLPSAPQYKIGDMVIYQNAYIYICILSFTWLCVYCIFQFSQIIYNGKLFCGGISFHMYPLYVYLPLGGYSTRLWHSSLSYWSNL